MTTRIPLVVLALVLAGTLAACGGSGGKTTPSTSTTTMSPAATKAAIKSAYERFFSSKTPTATRVKLLQNGQQFEAAIAALAKNPLASKTSATVSSVTLKGADKAKVVYTVNIAGSAVPGLKNRAGAAVLENGTWQVGDADFCALISLGGSPPKICKNLGS